VRVHTKAKVLSFKKLRLRMPPGYLRLPRPETVNRTTVVQPLHNGADKNRE